MEEQPKHAGGRPKKLSPELIEKAQAYIAETESAEELKLPTIEGLALRLNISRDTVYEWAKPLVDETATEDEKHIRQQFSDIVSNLRAAQGEKLIQNSLTGKYNASIAKLILSGKHNYVEKSEQDVNHGGEVTFTNGVPRPNAKG